MSRSRKVGEAITASDEREGERGFGSKGRHTVLDYILNRKTNHCQGLCWWDWPRLNVGCALKLQACSLPLLPVFCDWTFVSSGNFVLRGHSLKQFMESRPDAFLCIILYEKYVFRENWSEWGQTWRKKHSGLLMLACNFSIKSKWPECERLTIPQMKENKAIRTLNRQFSVVCDTEPLRVVMVTSGGTGWL